MTPENFRTGTGWAFRTSVLDRARKAANEHPELDVNTRVRLFVFGRFLARIFGRNDTTDGSWALKGATSLMARLHVARASKDIDLVTRQSLEEAERVVREAAQTDLGDHMVFELQERGEMRASSGKSFAVTAVCGGRELSRFKLDLAISANFPDELDMAPPLGGVDVPGVESISYPAWPLDRAVADKVAATFEMHNDQPSSRYRDLPDLYFLATTTGFDRHQLRKRVLAELAWRGIKPPGEFSVPRQPLWRRAWGQIAQHDAPSLISVPFDEALKVVKQFIDPLFGEDGDGAWDPLQRRWLPAP